MTTFLKKTDTRLHREVLEELVWDTRVDATDVGVEVDDCVVTLTGTVKSWAKRVAAEEAVRRVTGVLDVANDIDVAGPGTGLSDTDIAKAVRHAIEWDVFVPDTMITSSVTDGRVTLDGVVERWQEREDAERVVRNLAGVKRVVNTILVRRSTLIASDVRAAIEGALDRRAEREARRIRVDVHDGTVTLTGDVQSWAERKSVLAAARFTPGVRDVEDHLRTQHV